jgi:hypothetical protein
MGDFRGHPYAPIVTRVDAHNFTLATDLYVSAGNVFRESNHKFNGTTGAKRLFGEKIQSTIADVPGLRANSGLFPGKYLQGKGHRESSGLAALRSGTHNPPGKVCESLAET